jgi:hypothetical protein
MLAAAFRKYPVTSSYVNTLFELLYYCSFTIFLSFSAIFP